MNNIKDKRKIWTNQQITIFKQLFETYGHKKWKIISKQLRKKGFKRTQLQIRSKWINDLDPNLTNQHWHTHQLKKIYQLYNELGPRWAQINQQIEGRTQNKIKNKFYGNLRIFLRYVQYFFNGKRSRKNIPINKIPPNTLNNIYQGQQEYKFLQKQISTAIQQMNYQVEKNILEARIQQKKQLYEKLHNLVNILFQEMKKNEQIKKMLQEDEDIDQQDNDQDRKDEEYVMKNKYIYQMKRNEEIRQRRQIRSLKRKNQQRLRQQSEMIQSENEDKSKQMIDLGQSQNELVNSVDKSQFEQQNEVNSFNSSERNHFRQQIDLNLFNKQIHRKQGPQFYLSSHNQLSPLYYNSLLYPQHMNQFLLLLQYQQLANSLNSIFNNR